FKTVAKLLDKVRHKKGGVRLLGIKLSNLTSGNERKQLKFLSKEEDEKGDKLEQLTRSLDKIREKFGTKAVTRASLLK
ncbi:DNA polymerase IV, partial [Candidatus Woesearchaeota archaeon]